MGVYITTSKSAGRHALSLCQGLASILPNSIFERRGNKTIEKAVARARLLGKPRALIASDDELHFMKVSANSWDWLEPAISVKGAQFAKAAEDLPAELKLEGESAKIWLSLLNPSEPEGDDFIVAKCKKGSISFTYGRKKLGEMVFSHGSEH